MANPYLVVVAVILALLIIAGSIYILVYFQHPEDKLVAWGPKVVVVLSLVLACYSILMLPLDVANGRHGGFPMVTLWLIVYITMAILVVAVIPFATFYYEGDEYDETGKAPTQIAAAIKGTVIAIITFAVVSVVMYIFLGVAEIPVIQLTSVFKTTQMRQFPLNLTNSTGEEEPLFCQVNASNTYLIDPTTEFNYSTTLPNGTIFNYTLFGRNVTNYTIVIYDVYVNNGSDSTCFYNNSGTGIFDYSPAGNVNRKGILMKFRVSFALWIVSIIVFFGWILFIIFGGIGMVALPYDCIMSWQKRPIRISLEKYVAKKKEIGETATKLIDKGKAIQERQKKGRERRRDRKNYNKFRAAVFLLEEDYERLQECYKRQGGKLILHFLQFVFGIISAFLTVVWILHIFLYMITYPYPFSPFLNTLVIKLDDAWGLLGTFFYGAFSFYLLLCCIKGNFKFGMRVFILFPIHPMRVNNTLMNAFLFNCALIIFCAFAVGQFCTAAFADYTGETSINSLFGLAVKNLYGLKYIFIGYIYVLFIMVFLTAVYFFIKPKDKPNVDDIRV